MSQIDDSEDKIIERLGDCDIPVDYMDLLSHRVRCRRIEIFHYDDVVSFTSNNEGEEEEQSYGPLVSEDFTDDEDRTLQLAGNIDCLIRRIELMQLIMRQRKQDRLNEMSATSTQKLEDQKKEEQHLAKDSQRKKTQSTELSSDEQVLVRNLQQSHHILQCEIDEMICNYRVMRKLISGMRDQVCRENRNLRRLGSQSQGFMAWIKQVANEMTVCKQRYVRLLEKKISKEEAQRVINTHVIKTHKRNRNFLTKTQLQFDLREFNLEIEELLEYANDLHRDMIRRFVTIGPKSMRSNFSSMSTFSRLSKARKK